MVHVADRPTDRPTGRVLHAWLFTPGVEILVIKEATAGPVHGARLVYEGISIDILHSMRPTFLLSPTGFCPTCKDCSLARWPATRSRPSLTRRFTAVLAAITAVRVAVPTTASTCLG